MPRDNDRLKAAAAAHARQRSDDVVRKIDAALKAIEAQIKCNDGIYPENRGRITQAEVCRRAGIAEITLHSPVHRGTTKVMVANWIKERGVKTHPEVRSAVMGNADKWKREAHQVGTQIIICHERMKQLSGEIDLLKAENVELKRTIASMSGKNVVGINSKKG